MSNDTSAQSGRHIDHSVTEIDELETIIRDDRANAYGPAWRERFTSRHHLHNSLAS